MQRILTFAICGLMLLTLTREAMGGHCHIDHGSLRRTRHVTTEPTEGTMMGLLWLLTTLIIAFYSTHQQSV